MLMKRTWGVKLMVERNADRSREDIDMFLQRKWTVNYCYKGCVMQS